MSKRNKTTRILKVLAVVKAPWLVHTTDRSVGHLILGDNRKYYFDSMQTPYGVVGRDLPAVGSKVVVRQYLWHRGVRYCCLPDAASSWAMTKM